ncbi:MAG: hypothetical protein O7D32_08490 [bacterium]|nr:hypothetical protein [bacterium]
MQCFNRWFGRTLLVTTCLLWITLPTPANAGEGGASETLSLLDGSGEASQTSLQVRRVSYPINQSRFRLALSAYVGYSMAAGEWFDGLTHGPMAQGEIRAALNRTIYLGGSYRYQVLDTDADITGEVIVEDEFGNLTNEFWSWDVSLQEYMVIIGFMSSPASRTAPVGYIEFGFGGTYHDITLEFREVGTNFGGTSETKETKFAFSTAIGGIFPLGSQIGIDFQGNMRITGDQGGTDASGQTFEQSNGFLWGASLGVVLMFGEGL